MILDVETVRHLEISGLHGAQLYFLAYVTCAYVQAATVLCLFGIVVSTLSHKLVGVIS